MLECIHGKLGSGKSCFVVSLIVKKLEDWIRYELQENEPYSRVLFTNIPLDIEAINHYLQERITVNATDVGKYINLVDFLFFRNENKDEQK